MGFCLTDDDNEDNHAYHPQDNHHLKKTWKKTYIYTFVSVMCDEDIILSYHVPLTQASYTYILLYQ